MGVSKCEEEEPSPGAGHELEELSGASDESDERGHVNVRRCEAALKAQPTGTGRVRIDGDRSDRAASPRDESPGSELNLLRHAGGFRLREAPIPHLRA